MKSPKKSTAPIVKILSRLENVREGSQSFTALCPSHDDRHNSLSIAAGSDGRVLLFCFAGCDVRDVVEALGLELKDLFDHEPTKVRRRSIKRGTPWH
jgi:DNA primase